MKAGEAKAYKWTSDGKGEYEIGEAVRDGQRHHRHPFPQRRGEGIRQPLADRDHHQEIFQPCRLSHLHPLLRGDAEEDDKGAVDKQMIRKLKTEQVNSASALWKRPKTELKSEDYHEFYKVDIP